MRDNRVSFDGPIACVGKRCLHHEPKAVVTLRGDAGARSLQTCDTDRKKEGGASRTGIRLSTAAALARYRLLDQSQQGGSRCRLLSL
jgi:hypothetical protein